MRVVLVNWAPIAEGARRGGGVNGYCHALALELIQSGHEVVSLCGGTRYDSEAAPIRLARSAWGRVQVLEVVNSPVLAPSLAQFREPLGEVSAPALESLIADLMAEIRPDIVHFHNIEGFSAGCIPAVRRAYPRAKILFSLHNYHTICQQVYLLQGHRRTCFSFDNGHACVNCIGAPDPREERRRLAGLPVANASAAPQCAAAPPAAPSAAQSSANLLDEAAWPPRFVAGRGPHPWYGDNVPAWRPLLNVVAPEPPSDKPPNDYARRRAAMVNMLNSCDGVVAVSEFVARKFESMGVQRSRLHVRRIGSRMVELAATSHHPAQPPLTDQGKLLRPIRLVFMGYNNFYKGLPMLADSLDLLIPEVLACYHLCVYALEGQQMEPIFRTIEPRLGGLTLRHGYRYDEVPQLLADADLGVVPSVWWDNGPQTVMEFFACGVPVLAANLGGIPDSVKDGENGLLFWGNDRWDLARRLAQIARNPGLIPRLAANVRPPRTMRDHAQDMEHLYRQTLS